jgi:phenylpyruvate tautomerase PptA (4-oxalocrotonate tautomerase family)
MTPAQKAHAFDAVHDALVAAFCIPDHDRHQRIIEYAPEDFEIPPGKGARYMTVSLEVFAGRSLDAKRALYKEIVTRLAALEVPPADVLILLREVALENWGIRGGIPACDVDLGFNLRV